MCVSASSDTSSSKGARPRTARSASLQTADASVACVSASIIASRSNTSTSKGAVPRTTSRSASQSADSAAVTSAGSAYDATLSVDNMQRSLLSSSARSASTLNSNARSSFFSTSTSQPNVSSTKRSSSITNIELAALRSSAACEDRVNDFLSGEHSSNATQPPNGLNGISLLQDIIRRIDGLSSRIAIIKQRTERFRNSPLRSMTLSRESVCLKRGMRVLPLSFLPLTLITWLVKFRFVFIDQGPSIHGMAKERPDPASDMQRVTDALSRFPGLSLNGLSVRRVPSRRSDIPRPIVARLNSQDDVIRVLRNQRLLPSGLTTRADRTEAERNRFQLLLDQVNQHNETHPEHKNRIEYVNGIPTVVPVRNRRNKEN